MPKRVSAFRAMYYGPATGTTATTLTPATGTNWTQAVGGIAAFDNGPDVRTLNEHNQLPIVLSVADNVQLELTQDNSYNALKALEGTLLNVAFERVDGSFLIYKEVEIEVQYMARAGADAVRPVGVRVTGAARRWRDLVEF